MFTFFKSIFRPSKLDRTTQIKRSLNLNLPSFTNIVQKYDYHFNGKCIKELLFCYAENDSFLYIGYDDLIIVNNQHYIKIWDPQTYKPIFDYLQPYIRFLLSLPDKRIVVSVGPSIKIININTHTHVLLKGHTQRVLSAIFHLNTIITYSEDMSIRIWTLDGQCLFVFIHDKDIASMLISKCGTKLITRCFDNSVRVWDLSSLGTHDDLQMPDILRMCNVKKYDIETIPDLRNFGKSMVRGFMGILPDENILSYSKDRYLQIWNHETQKYDLKKHVHFSRIRMLSDGRIAVIRSKKLEIWN